MKKSGFLVPAVIAALFLLLVLLVTIFRNDFKRSIVQTGRMAISPSRILGPLEISGEMTVVKFGIGKLPLLPSGIQIKEIDPAQIMSPDTKLFFSDTTRKKLLFSNDISLAARYWALLTRMGYSKLYIYDPGFNRNVADSLNRGNEIFHYTFKPKYEASLDDQ